jgi:hypothetical protein
MVLAIEKLRQYNGESSGREEQPKETKASVRSQVKFVRLESDKMGRDPMLSKPCGHQV